MVAMETTTATAVANLPLERVPLKGARLGCQEAASIALVGPGGVVCCSSGVPIAEALPPPAEETGLVHAARAAPSANSACTHMVFEGRRSYIGGAEGT